MVPIQNVKMTVGPIWNTGGTETEIIVPVSVLGPERAGTEMGSDPAGPPLTIYIGPFDMGGGGGGKAIVFLCDLMFLTPSIVCIDGGGYFTGFTFYGLTDFKDSEH